MKRFRLMEYESATEELCSFLGRKDFRVMWDPRSRRYEVQQYISGGWDEIRSVMNGTLTHLFYPCFFWSTILTTDEWHAGIKYEVHWGLTVPAETILGRLEKGEDEVERDDKRQIADASHEVARWSWQATPHKTIYSTAR